MNEWIAWLFQALSTPYGIALRTEDPQRAIQKLQEQRRAVKNPDFDALVIAVSRTNPDGEIWIVHQPEQAGDLDAA